MDTYNKLRQYNVDVLSDKWINIGSITFPSCNEIRNFKFEILYSDNKVNNLIICHLVTDVININFNKFNKFIGNAVIYELNQSNFTMKVVQLSNFTYEMWCNFNSYIGKALLYIYGDYIFQLENTPYDYPSKDYPNCIPIKYTLSNNNNKFYTKQEIEEIINNSFVKKSDLDNKLLNLTLNSSGSTDSIINILNDNYVKIANISKYIENYYTKQEINELLKYIPTLKELYDNFIRKDETNTLPTNNNLQNCYTSSDINSLLKDKLDRSEMYTKLELNALLNNKCNTTDVLYKTETYHKNVIDNLLERKVSSYNSILNNAVINNVSLVGTIEGISKLDVGLDNVDNTSDINKPISTVVLNQLNKKANISDLDNKADKVSLLDKAPINNPTFTGTVNGITKDMIGLYFVDNTSDINKPLSKLMIEALNNKGDLNLVNTKANQSDVNLKAPINNPTFTGTVKGIDKHMIDLGKVDNTSDESKPLSYLTRIELELKANVTDLNTKAPINNPIFTGIVKGITKDMIGLSNVNNTPDSLKPITIEMQSELNRRAPINNPTFTGTVKGITKDMIGLDKVNNISDIDKPLSSLMITALNTKASINSPTFTGTVYGITKDMIGLSEVDNTNDLDKPLSINMRNALNTKVSSYDPKFTGTLLINNISLRDNNNTSYINSTSDNLYLGQAMNLNKLGQILCTSNIENDFGFKIQNNGYGLTIDNSSQYALCIRDKLLRIKSFIGSDNTAMFCNNAVNISNNKFGINTNNPNYELHVEGTAFCTKGVWEPSDARIKNNISDVDITTSLNTVNSFKLKKYNYIEDNVEDIGVIAQELKKILPNAVSISRKFIPSIMKPYNILNNYYIQYENNDEITFNNMIININVNFFNLDVTTLQKLRIYNSNEYNTNVAYEDVLIEYNINNPDIITLIVNNIEFTNKEFIFIYGHEIDDFNSIDKNKLFMPLIGAVQALTQRNNMLENRIKALEDKLNL